MEFVLQKLHEKCYLIFKESHMISTTSLLRSFLVVEFPEQRSLMNSRSVEEEQTCP